jgi:hypothetical protein
VYADMSPASHTKAQTYDEVHHAFKTTQDLHRQQHDAAAIFGTRRPQHQRGQSIHQQ